MEIKKGYHQHPEQILPDYLHNRLSMCHAKHVVVLFDR